MTRRRRGHDYWSPKRSTTLQIPKDQIIAMLERDDEPGDADKADQANQELPDQVDTTTRSTSPCFKSSASTRANYWARSPGAVA